jgi:3-isopropylmalate dehydrogenase
MTHGHALWQRVFKEMSPQYPSIEATHLYIDALAMLLVQTPERFEVIVTNNPFGAILSAALMLDTLGRAEDARRIERAVEAAVHAGETTRDIGGSLGTSEAGAAILRHLT